MLSEPIATFSAAATITGYENPEVSESDHAIVKNATAASLGLSSAYLTFTGVNITANDAPQGGRRLSIYAPATVTRAGVSINDHSTLRGSQVQRTAAVVYTIEYFFEVYLPLEFTDFDNVTELYNSVNKQLSTALEEGRFLESLHKAAATVGVQLPEDLAGSVTLGELIVVIPQNSESTDDGGNDGEGGSSGGDTAMNVGLLVGVTVGGVLVAVVLAFLGFRYWYRPRNRKTLYSHGRILPAIDNGTDHHDEETVNHPTSVQSAESEQSEEAEGVIVDEMGGDFVGVSIAFYEAEASEEASVDASEEASVEASRAGIVLSSQ